MKVLHFCMSRGWGGLEMASAQWAKLFAQHGHESHSMVAPQSPLAQQLQQKKLPYIEVNFREYFSPLQSLQLREYVIKHKIEAVFLQSLRDLWVVSPALLGLPTQLIGFAQMWLEGINKKDFLHTLIHRRMDRLIALTPLQGAQVLKCLPFPSEKTVVIPNSIDPQRFSPLLKNKNIRQQLGASDSDILIGLVGRLDPQKGQREAIEAFALALQQSSLPLKLALVGDPTADAGNDYLSDLHKTANELGVQDHVCFAGFRSDVPEVMASLDIFLLNSYREAFGFVIVEAMMSGATVIATNSGGVPDVVGKYGKLVSPKNNQELSQALIQLASQKELREKLSQSALTYSVNHYDENKNFDKMISLLKTIPPRRNP